MFSVSAKRQREDDAFGVDVFSVRERKKPRPLPLQTSSAADDHTLARLFSATLTPEDSSEDEEDDGSTGALWSSRQPQQASRPPVLVLDTPMDLDSGRPTSLPLASGDNLSPWPPGVRDHGVVQPSPIPHHLIDQSLNLSGGHVATPIYGHFNEGTLNAPSDVMMDDDSPTVTSSNVEHGKETAWWRRRRLPSPISEDEGSGDCLQETQFLRGQTCPASPPMKSFDGLLEEQDEPVMMMEATQDLEPNTTKPPQAPPVKKGRISISMGYRADCEKCRRKIPGHYSHIIRS
ncbi:hypothetical protein ASPZODRAFT_136845 [Penicilliopsis zonata CBS 506.65]|uniref:Uncharacterized protein n=1 Tax=Penicilliopsis zonata CBS 506.65 TaxID=1073090 RepID=A0A1L9S737_9EURO|nr:hypothetical protein ASPZODRAFT_136845 [Penicilliopsis zonata CBS 506.65]OJJ42973.1 hypothetical protein ASPZODRAFT_136845 [Penicilliopsis zonata CBS 506.65]